MTRIYLQQLIWNKYNKEHFKKHKVTIQEIKEALRNFRAHRKGNKGRFILTGRSGEKLISIIIAPEKNKKYYVVTARSADRKERKLVYEKEK